MKILHRALIALLLAVSASAQAPSNSAPADPYAVLLQHVDKLLADLPACAGTDLQKELQRDSLNKIRAELLALQQQLARTRTSGQEKLALSNPNNNASTALPSPSIALGLSGSDSFNRDVRVTLTVQYPFGMQPDGGAWKGDLKTPVFSTSNSAYIPSVSFSYDDKWKAAPSKAGASNPSTVTQQYSGELLNLSNLFHLHTVIGMSGYHDNSQGVVYDLEPTVGLFALWTSMSASSRLNFAKLKTSDFLIVGLAGQGDFTQQYGTTSLSSLGGLHAYTLAQWIPKQAPKSTIGFNLRGFLATTDPASNGHASAATSYSYNFTSGLAFSLAVVDTYYASVPSGYNHNSLAPTISLKFTPKTKPSSGQQKPECTNPQASEPRH
jgi:hypothetical protein